MQVGQALLNQLKEIQQVTTQVQQENETLKADTSAKMQKTQSETFKTRSENQFKDRDLKLREGEAFAEANKPVVTPQEQWAYDERMEAQKREHETIQAQLDRQVDVAKAIISKTDDPDPDEAMDQAGDIVQAITDALTAPRVVIYEGEKVVGSEVVQ